MSQSIVNKVLSEMEALGNHLREKFNFSKDAPETTLDAHIEELLKEDSEEGREFRNLWTSMDKKEKPYEILEVSGDDWLVVDAQPKETTQGEDCVLELSGEELEKALSKSASLRVSTKKATETILATKPTLGE